MRILFLHDHIPEDARPDVADALTQVEFIGGVLSHAGHQLDRLSMTANLEAVEREIRYRNPDLVFNLVESVGGQGRLIYVAPAVLDTLGVWYTGAHTDAMFITSSKLLTKRWLRSAGLPTAPWHAPGRTTTPASQIPDGDESESLAGVQWPAKFIIKSVWEEASVGLDDASIVTADCPAALDVEIARRAPRLGGEAFAEAFVDGREFNLSLLARTGGGVEVLPPAEIQFVDFEKDKPRIVGYAAKWDETSFEYVNTPRTFDFAGGDRALLDQLSKLARRCWSVFDLRGYARVDFRVDENGRPFILEINANPCLSPDAGFMAAAGRAGLSDRAVVERILDAAR